MITLLLAYTNPRPYQDPDTPQVYGTAYDVDRYEFDEATETVAHTTEYYDDFQDHNPPGGENFQGEFYHYCVPGTTTRRGFTHDGFGGFTVAEQTDSPECGYVPPPPPVCELGTLRVSQAATSSSATSSFTLTASVDGTAQAALRYSLDGEPEQDRNVFAGVALGPHTLRVRDTGVADCVRTASVVVAPPAEVPAVPAGAPAGVDFVGQPLWYSPGVVPAGAEVQLELWAESAHGQEDFALVLALRKRANAQGRVNFRLDTLLWPLLSAWVPLVGLAATQRCTTNLLNYQVRTTTFAAGQLPVAVSGPLRTAVRGGLPAEWQQVNYFRFRTQVFAAAPFLSWQPAGAGTYAGGQAKRVTAAQSEWLGWLCPVDVAGLRIARAYDMGPGTVPLVDYELLGEAPARGWLNQLLAIPLAAARPDFKRLRVQVETPDGEALSLPAWYEFVAETPRSRYLLFTNSLGMVDTLRCEGRLESTLEATTDKVERPARPGEAAPAADRQVADLSASRKLKLASGWLSPAELEWAQEVVLSREIWQQLGGQLYPLDWGKRSLATYSDEPGLRGLLLEFDYAYAPTAYAPAANYAFADD